jgi:hypothetical protein
MYTRKQYLNGECTHREYYSQLVNKGVINQVLSNIGREAILDSTEESFNDIKLSKWDSIRINSLATSMKALGDYLTQAGSVCILKEAARQIKEQK